MVYIYSTIFICMKQFKFHRLKYLAHQNHEKYDILNDLPLGYVIAPEKYIYILADSQPQNNSQQKQALNKTRVTAQYFRCRS